MKPVSNPTSPVVKDGSTFLVNSFAASDIVRLYKEQTGLDVRRFFAGVPEVALYECAVTGYRFYHPFQVQGDAEFYGELYRGNIEQGREYDRDWSEDHEFALNQIAADDKVLEIGCGSGKFLERAQSRAHSVVGLEIERFAASKARDKGIDIRVESPQEHHLSQAEYSVVCAFQVLEHEGDVGGFMSTASSLLRPGGHLILSVPNSDPYYQRFNKYEVMNLPPHHLGLWRLDSLTRLGVVFEFELVGHSHFAWSRLLVDAYLRAKLWTGVKSLPRRHSTADKAAMLAVAPLTVIRSAMDYAVGKVNHAYLVVALRKRT